MMARITTTCPTCGTVTLTPQDIVLVTSPREGQAWYSFDCFDCARRVVKEAPADVAMALSRVRVETWTVPAEVLERWPEPAGTGPRLGIDDVLDVALTLRGCDHLAALAGGEGAEPRR